MWDIISFYSDSFAIPVLSYFIKRSVTKWCKTFKLYAIDVLTCNTIKGI
jgi:hypothetical protein